MKIFNPCVASRQEKLRKEKKKNETIIQVGAQHHINRILNSKGLTLPCFVTFVAFQKKNVSCWF